MGEVEAGVEGGDGVRTRARQVLTGDPLRFVFAQPGNGAVNQAHFLSPGASPDLEMMDPRRQGGPGHGSCHRIEGEIPGKGGIEEQAVLVEADLLADDPLLGPDAPCHTLLAEGRQISPVGEPAAPGLQCEGAFIDDGAKGAGGDQAAEVVRGRVGAALAKWRRQLGRTAAEDQIEGSDRIAEVDSTVIVGIAGIEAGELVRDAKEVLEDGDGIRDVDSLVAVRLAADESGQIHRPDGAR